MSKEFEKEVGEMDEAFGEPKGTEAPKTEVPGTTVPGTEVPGTESPSTKVPSTDAPATKAPTTEAPAEDPRDVEMRKLREEIDELKKAKEPEPTKAPSTEAPIPEEDFLGDVNLEDLDKEKFNKVLNAVYMKVIEFGKTLNKNTADNLIKSIPTITQNNQELVTKLKEINEKFYKDNKDLVPWKKTVAAVFGELAAEDPEASYEKILPKVADEVRERIGLQKPTPGNDDPPPPPKRGPGGKRQTTKGEPSAFDKEIDEMEKALEA